MNKMWAQVLTSPGQLEYKKIDIPDYNEDQILVKLKTAAICNGSDPDLLHDTEIYSPPYVFGHEPLGKVEACGKEVKNFQVGDRVSWWFSQGAFAEYVVVNPAEVAIVKVPDVISDTEGPLLELMTASYRAVKESDVYSETRVLIIGLGPSGLIMSQRAKALGAKEVIGWDLYSLRREKGSELGCDYVFDPRDEKIVEKTKKINSNIDLIIDAMGNDRLPDEPTLDMAIQLLKNNGKIISYGHPSQGRRFNPSYFQRKAASMESPVQQMDMIQKLIETGVQDVMEGKVNLNSLVSKEIKLNEVSKGLKLVSQKPDKYLKLIVNIDK